MSKTQSNEVIVNKLLAPFMEDLWIKRHLNVKQILDSLENYKLNLINKKDNNSSNLLAEEESLNEWIRFFKFLETYCCGENFENDKQWSELLNLMEISKKLNHNSVKVKDIIKNKTIIETQNCLKIKRLNKSAKLLKTIESSLNELEKSIQDCRLELPHSSVEKNKNIEHELFISKQFVSIENYLQDKCYSVLYMLRLELTDDLVSSSKDPRIPSWQLRIQKQEIFINKLKLLFHLLFEIKLKLNQLKQLIGFDNDNSSTTTTATSNQNDINRSIDICKENYKKIHKYYHKLLELFYKFIDNPKKTSTSLKSKSVQKEAVNKKSFVSLVKLFKTNKPELVEEFDLVELEKISNELDNCQSTLDKIIQRLRLEFGRFYFVNDVELLSIIALDVELVIGTDASSLVNNEKERLIRKLFNNSINSFILNDDKTHLIGLKSSFGEILFLHKNDLIILRKKINLYSLAIVRILNEISRKLSKTMKRMLFESLSNDEDSAIDLALPVQLINLKEYINFVGKVEKTLLSYKFDNNKKSLQELVNFYENKFKNLSSSSSSIEESNNSMNEFKTSALSSLMIHFISILLDLESNNVNSINSWYWQKQVRYYTIDVDDADSDIKHDIAVCIADTKFKYKFDFLPLETNDLTTVSNKANSNLSYKRLISTQITERCFLVSSQSIGILKLGTNPYGPAGSGKTETIKALGQLLGCQVIVHNCDESNDSESLEKLIWGLAHTGLWGCFDEFNRLSSSVLSTVSETLELVQTSLRENKTTVERLSDGQLTRIDPYSAFFITLNPAKSNSNSSSYGGRRRLPANLRNIFIPISMARVEIDSIVRENLMTLNGELNHLVSLKADKKSLAKSFSLIINSQMAIDIGKKLGYLLEEMKTIKSSDTKGDDDNKRKTCEWDLRLVMAILKRFKIQLLFNYKFDDKSNTNVEQYLLKSIKDEVEPRIIQSDLYDKFVILAEKLFGPALKMNEFSSLDLNQNSISKDLGEHERKFLHYLNDQLKIRGGVILLGPTKSGKSLCWKTLDKFNMGNVRWFPIDPKCCDKNELFGYVSPLNQKWYDGILTARVREALELLEENKIEQVWLILDGPIDPDWIESLNSVLDDNQILTLSSGERIPFKSPSGKSIKLIFETDNIEYASPATISRLGLISFDNKLNAHESNKTIGMGELKSFISDKETKLLINESSTSHLTLEEFLVDNKKDFDYHDLITYNCNELTSTSHLLNLIKKFTNMRNADLSSIIILNNVCSIKTDNWKANRFMELLRFIITYGGYYDLNSSSLSFVSLEKIKFIININSIELLDKRIVSLASFLLFKGDEVQKTKGPNQNRHVLDSKNLVLDDINFENLFNSENHLLSTNSIITINSQFYGTEHGSRLMQLLSNDCNVYQFSNSRLSKESIENLERILFKVSNRSSSSQLTGSNYTIYILNEQELSLMELNMKRSLLDYLNWLSNNKKLFNTVKFIYLTHRVEVDGKDYQFWSKMGLMLDDNFDFSNYINNSIESIENLFNSSEISTISSNQENVIAWVNNKIRQLLSSSNEMLMFNNNLMKFQSFLEIFINLFTKSQASFLNQKKIFTNGLKQLNNFDKNILQIKTKCDLEEEKLSKQKINIQKIMSDIDEGLKVSQRQKEQIEDLKKKQQSSAKELVNKSKNIELELSKVKPLVEQSKSQIIQHLKPEALNEIKTLRSPPKTIKDILDVLFILLKIEDSSWTSMKAYLTKYSLKDELTNYNIDKHLKLDSNLVKKVENEIMNKKDSFNQQQAARASKAIVPILNWIIATLEYGKAMIRVMPLTEESNKLEIEKEFLSKRAVEIEKESFEINKNIELKSKQLKELEADYEKSRKEAEKVNFQLLKAQKVRSELNDQIKRCQDRLNIINLLLESDELIKICLAASYLANYKANSIMNTNSTIELLKNLLKLFELNHLKIDKFISNMLILLKANKDDDEELIIWSGAEQEQLIMFNVEKNPEELNKIIQIIIMDLFCCATKTTTTTITISKKEQARHLLIPFLDIEASNKLTKEELIQSLAFKSILVKSPNEISLIRCDQEQESWQQSLELSIKLNKLIVIKLPNDDNYNTEMKGRSLVLDLLDLIYNKLSSNRIILTGCLLQYKALKHNSNSLIVFF